ncbi:MAG: triose-phosphate isomerase [Candidatus Altiarchaeales archaeon]|nr:triose-phosphate isomerase [Candidatus Altiarchaeales archaeon]
MTVDLSESIVVNFKTYEKATGVKALDLALTCEEVAEETEANIVVAVQPTDIMRVVENVDIPVFAQHVDDVGYGSNTGWILAESLAEAGAVGSLINHSEHKLSIPEIESRIKKIKQVGLTSIVCSGLETEEESIEETKKICVFKPDYVAVEPPDLIGGDVSVTSRPELITSVVEAVQQVNPHVGVLTGAGVKSKEHVAKALELGTKGVLLASGVVKSHDPKAALTDLVEGLGV